MIEANWWKDAEKALFVELAKITSAGGAIIGSKRLHHRTLLNWLHCVAPIDALYYSVMVMADDAELKANRLCLLAQLRDLFTRVADLSVLQH